MGLFSVPPDAVAKSLKLLREERLPVHRRIIRAGDSDGGRVQDAMNWIGLDIVGASSSETYHPDQAVLAVNLKNESPRSVTDAIADDELVMRPGDVACVPMYDGFSYRRVDFGDVGPAVVPPDLRLWYGWTWVQPCLPRNPGIGQRPILRSATSGITSGTIEDTVGTTAAGIGTGPVDFVTIQNRHATQTLYVAVGATATTDSYEILSGAEKTLPVGDLAEVSVIADGAATSFVVLWQRSL